MHMASSEPRAGPVFLHARRHEINAPAERRGYFPSPAPALVTAPATNPALYSSAPELGVRRQQRQSTFQDADCPHWQEADLELQQVPGGPQWESGCALRHSRRTSQLPAQEGDRDRAGAEQVMRLFFQKLLRNDDAFDGLNVVARFLQARLRHQSADVRIGSVSRIAKPGRLMVDS